MAQDGIRSVGFSSRGTLVATAEGLVNASEAGYAVEELDAIVRVGTKDVLPKLAREKRLRRTRIRNRNVYFSPKRSIREQQIASRRVWEAQPSVSKSIAASRGHNKAAIAVANKLARIVSELLC